MPRDRRPLEDVARTFAVNDRALEGVRFRGEAPDVEEEDEERDWRPAAYSKRLRQEWPDLKLDERMFRLRAELKTRFLKRFGYAWDDRRNGFMTDPAWPPKRQHRQKGRGLASRPRLVKLLDFENQLYLPDRDDGSPRFLSVLELTWVSILAGHWPPSAPRSLPPDKVVLAERELIKKALARHGQKPLVLWDGENSATQRLRRGPQRRPKK